MTESITVTEKMFNMGEIALNTVEASTSGTPLVMLHGGLRWWQDWQDVMPQFARDWHVYVYDLRGHGKSGRDADHYHLTDFARDNVAFLRGCVAEPAVLVGQSLGALVSIATAAQAPEMVRAIVLLDPPIFLRSEPITLLKEYSDWFVFVYDLLSRVQSYEGLMTELRAMFPGGDEDRIKVMADSLYGLDPAMIDVLLRNHLFDGFDIAQAFEQITCPTLILQADWDHGGAMRDSDIDFVRAHLPSAQIVKFPEFSHLLLQEHPDLMAHETEKFLASI